MHVMELKAMLNRSNPAVVRQFTVSPQMTLGELQEVLAVLLGWNPQKSWKMWNSERKLQNRDDIKGTLEESAPVFFCPHGQEKFVFRVVLVGEREQEEPYPRIIRWRGPNPPEEMKDTESFNRLQGWWSGKRSARYGLAFYMYDYGDYKFLPQEISGELRRRFSPEKENRAETAPIRLNYREAGSMGQILGSYKVQELKEIAAGEGIHIPAGMRKAELTEYLLGQFDRMEVLERHLCFLTMGEYRAFQAICMREEDRSDHALARSVAAEFGRLGWMDAYYYGDGFEILPEPSRELLLLYEEWIDAGKEKEFLNRSRIYTSIRGCVRLYGLIRKDHWLPLAAGWLGEEFKKKELEDGWQEYFVHIAKGGNTMAGCCYPDLFYDKQYLTEDAAVHFWDKFKEVPLYPVSFEQLKQYEAEGLYFEASQRLQLENFLRNRCRIYEDEVGWMGREIYHDLRCNTDVNALSSYYMRQFYIRDKKLQKEFSGMLENLNSCIRRIEYGGHTVEEYRKVMQGSDAAPRMSARNGGKKVYPNDPCPCGSGKKYKQCHGLKKA